MILNRFPLTKSINLIVQQSIRLKCRLVFDTYNENLQNRRPVVILHGLFGNKNNWRGLAKAMNRRLGAPVYCLDLRNHGGSPQSDEMTYDAMADDIELFMHNEKLEKSVLIGHSMGGKAAMVLALRAPDRIGCLVPVDTAPSTSPAGPTVSGFIEAMEDVKFEAGKSLAENRQSASRQMASTNAALRDSPGVRQYLLTNLEESQQQGARWRINLSVLKRAIPEILEFPSSYSNSSFSKTCHFIAGGNSNYITKKEIPKMNQLFPKNQIHTVAGAGHWVHSDKPNEFLELFFHLYENECS